MGFVETRNLQRADQSNPLASAESSGQILVSALSPPDLGEDGPVMVNISNFTTVKILDK
jgi:hypothetical protein